MTTVLVATDPEAGSEDADHVTDDLAGWLTRTARPLG
jgi:hypothetical protein